MKFTESRVQISKRALVQWKVQKISLHSFDELYDHDALVIHDQTWCNSPLLASEVGRGMKNDFNKTTPTSKNNTANKPEDP